MTLALKTISKVQKLETILAYTFTIKLKSPTKIKSQYSISHGDSRKQTVLKKNSEIKYFLENLPRVQHIETDEK